MADNRNATDSNTPPQRHGRDLTTGSIPRHLVMFSLPMLAGSTLQTAYSIINAIWVGKFLGKTDLAAVTVSFPVIFVLMALAGGLTLASNILVSQYVGARNWGQVKRVVQTSTVLIGAISVVFLVIGEVFATPLLRAMNTPSDVLPLASGYLRIMLLTLPMQFAMFLIASNLRGVGDSTTPLYFQTVFLILTAILDPLLMFGVWIFPRLGLNGTAVATLITMTGGIISLLIYLHRRKSIVAPDWRNLRADRATAWLLTKIGAPSAMQQSLVSIGMVFVIGFVNKFGEDAVAAFGAGSRIDMIAFMPAMTMNMAVSTLAGQNIGARLFHRVKEIFWWGLLISGGITLLVSLVAVSEPGALLSMFINTQRDAAVLNLSTHYLRIVGASYVLFAVMFVSNGVINGAGHTFMTTLISLVGLWVIRVPLAYLLPKYVTRDVTGIWYAMAISFGVTMLISIAYYFSGRWKRSVVKHPPIPPEEAILNDQGLPVLEVIPALDSTDKTA